MGRPQIIILGTFHFREAYEELKLESEQRKSELHGIINSIAEFKPNKLSVELRSSEEEKYNSLYQSYLNYGSLNLN